MHGGAALREIELVAQNRTLDILMDLVVRGALVMIGVSVDDHEIFVAARHRLVLGLGQVASRMELFPDGSLTIGLMTYMFRSRRSIVFAGCRRQLGARSLRLDRPIEERACGTQRQPDLRCGAVARGIDSPDNPFRRPAALQHRIHVFLSYRIRRQRQQPILTSPRAGIDSILHKVLRRKFRKRVQKRRKCRRRQPGSIRGPRSEEERTCIAPTGS